MREDVPVSSIEFHRTLLADGVRNRAFAEALRRVVVPGETVLVDIGAGTGFLSFLASSLSAKECVLVESGAILKVAQYVAKKSGIRRCRFIAGHSRTAAKNLQADVVVSETLGNFALEEHLLENMEDGKRILKPGGALIPATLTQWVAPVTSDRFLQELLSWDRVGFGLNFSAAREITLQNLYVRRVSESDLLPGGAERWDHIDFRQRNGLRRHADVTWTLERDTTVYGFALWWECELVPGVLLSTTPSAPATHWEQIYLPVLSPLAKQAGDTLRLRLLCEVRHGKGVHVVWKADGQHLDMRRGYVA